MWAFVAVGVEVPDSASVVLPKEEGRDEERSEEAAGGEVAGGEVDSEPEDEGEEPAAEESGKVYHWSEVFWQTM